MARRKVTVPALGTPVPTPATPTASQVVAQGTSGQPGIPAQPLAVSSVDQLDATDKLILLQIVRNHAASDESIAKAVGITRNTVMARKKRPLFRLAETQLLMPSDEIWKEAEPKMLRRFTEMVMAASTEREKDRAAHLLSIALAYIRPKPAAKIELGGAGAFDFLDEIRQKGGKDGD